MEEKQTKSKETDITAILVITFVVLVAVLIARVAADFSAQKTSSSTRASVNIKGYSLKAKPKVVGKVKYQNPDICGQTYASTELWFNECVPVTQDQCKDKCTAGSTIVDDTAYGKLKCPDQNRCLPITGTSNVKTLFSFTPDNLSSKFCEEVTGVTGAVCYDSNGGLNIKGLDISEYDSFYTSERNNMYGDYTFYEKGINWFWFFGEYYYVECPLYVTVLGGGADTFNGVVKSGAPPLDHIKSGYCYVPKATTP